MMAPRLSFQCGAQLSVAVPYPFFNDGTVDTFPGQLRSRPTVSRRIAIRASSRCLTPKGAARAASH